MDLTAVKEEQSLDGLRHLEQVGQPGEPQNAEHEKCANGNPAEPAQQQSRSHTVKANEKRTKKGKRKAAVPGQPPPLGPDDYVRVVPVPKKTEVLREGWRPVSLSNLDKATLIELDKSQHAATFRKGYRTVRATHGACEGTWYYEVEVRHLGASGHARVGWSTRNGELQAPVGYDKHGYAYRDLEGTKVHQALREEYGESYQEGDVIGCLVHLGQGGRPFEKERSDIVAWKGGLYFRDEPGGEEPTPLKGSLVAFTKNGRLQGVAYRELSEGTYYPALSAYTLPYQAEGAALAANFGPDFNFPPPEVEGCPAAQPVSKLCGDPPPPATTDTPVPTGGCSGSAATDGLNPADPTAPGRATSASPL